MHQGLCYIATHEDVCDVATTGSFRAKAVGARAYFFFKGPYASATGLFFGR